MSVCLALRRARSTEQIIEAACRVTLSAHALKGPLAEFAAVLYDEGFFLASASADAAPVLENLWGLTDTPAVKGVEFFAPEYAARFLIARAEQQSIPLPQHYAKKLIELLYEKRYVCCLATDSVREFFVKSLVNSDVEIKFKTQGDTNAVSAPATEVRPAAGSPAAPASPAASDAAGNR
jgi:hypothetical protein